MSPQRFDHSHSRWGAFALVGAIAVLSACNDDAGDDDAVPVTWESELTAFASCDALDDYLTDIYTDALAESYAFGGYYNDAVSGGGDDLGAPTSPAGDRGGAESPTDFSTTNVQELGIDEPDLVKSSGDYMYVVNGQQLHVLQTWPAEELHETGTVELPGWGEWMFLVDDRVVVMRGINTGSYPDTWGGGRDTPTDVGAPEPMPDEPGDREEPAPDPITSDTEWFQGVRVMIIDVSDPAAPQVETHFDIEGDYVDARLVAGRVYLITRHQALSGDPELYAAVEALELPVLEWDASAEEREAASASIRRAVRPIIADYVARAGRDALIPDLRDDEDTRAPLFTCGQLMRPAARAGFGVLSVVGFDPTGAGPEGVGLVADGWEVYGSAESLYIAQDSRWWMWASPEGRFAETHIHRFSIGDGVPRYEASGAVDGWVLNQFSMSEFDGHLRVATTDQTDNGWLWGGDVAVASDGGVGTGTVSPGTTTGGGATPDDAPDAPPEVPDGAEQKDVIDLYDGPEDANNVFILAQEGRRLEVVGGLRGIAPTERIYSVRFLGDRGYVVTFRQTDPLFTLDLSDPTRPSIEGELHIPGFSSYLHPLGADHLIGIGQDATDEGRVTGLQLQIFDVSDPADPQRTHQELLALGEGSYAWSEAEHDHHAFTYYESRGWLAIPVTLEDHNWEEGTYSHFSGVIVFAVDAETGFTEVGRISHTMMARDRYCSEPSREDPEARDACESWEYPWWIQMRRAHFVEDSLFAFSELGVTASGSDDFADVLAEVRY